MNKQLSGYFHEWKWGSTKNEWPSLPNLPVYSTFSRCLGLFYLPINFQRPQTSCADILSSASFKSPLIHFFDFMVLKISHRPNSVHIFMRRLTFLIWLYFSHLEQFILNLTHFYYRPKVEKPIWNILIRIYEINEGQSTGQTSANVRRRDF